MLARLQRNLAILDSLQGLFLHAHTEPAVLERHRNRQVRRLVQFANRYVPFWRRHFQNAGVDPGAIRGVPDLAQIPPVSRSELQDVPASELVASYLDPERLYAHRTSGATGQPLTFRRTVFEQRLLGVFRKRAFLDMGISPRARIAWVALPRREHQEIPSLPRRLMYAAGFYRLRKFSCLLEMEELASQLRDWRPDVLIGFGATVARLGEFLLEQRSSGASAWRPSHTVICGEVVTERMRQTIDQAFDGPPLEMYGSVEFGLIGWRRRPDSPLTVVDDAVILEVVRDGHRVAVGEEGEVLATGLLSWSMPLIRYRLGDVVVQTQPSRRDERRWPFGALRSVQGRQLDFFTLRDGRQIHSWHVTIPVVLESPWIRHYRIVQEAVDRFVIYVVPDCAPTQDRLCKLRDRAVQALDSRVEVEVRTVPELPTAGSGKFRIAESFVESQYANERPG